MQAWAEPTTWAGRQPSYEARSAHVAPEGRLPGAGGRASPLLGEHLEEPNVGRALDVVGEVLLESRPDDSRCRIGVLS